MKHTRRVMHTLTLTAALAVAGCSSATGPDDESQSEGDPAVFTYDRSTDVDLRVTPSDAASGATVYQITYKSPKGGLVTGLLAVPLGQGPFAGIIAQHGMPGVASQMRPDLIAFANAGAVAIAIDAPFNRRSGGALTMTPQDSVDQVQLMTDLQRAVDILRARTDVDDKRIGYFGYSYGAAMGALLAGVERRISTFVLSVGDGGLVAHMTGPDDPDWSKTEPGFERWRAAMNPIEPIHYIGNASPAKLYFQSARQDELVPPADATRLHEAASEPKVIQWYDTGHNLGAVARQDRHNWFVQHLGIKPAG